MFLVVQAEIVHTEHIDAERLFLKVIPVEDKIQIISKEISKLDKEIAWESSAIIQLFKVLNERAIDMTDLVIANNISVYSSDE